MDSKFAIETFYELFDKDESELSLVIKGHFAIDSIIDEVLHMALDNSNSLELKRISFILKVDILISLGLLNTNCKPLFNNINKVRNKFAHNPYSIFDESDVKKAKITLLQTNIYDEVVKEFELSQPFLNITLIAGFITIEALLKNEYRKKHQLLMINERIRDVFEKYHIKPDEEKDKEFTLKVESELKNLYPNLFDN